MTKLIVKDAAGNALASDRIDGTLWRLNKYGLFTNVSEIEMECHGRGVSTALEVWVGNEHRVNGTINQQPIRPGETLHWSPGQFTFKINLETASAPHDGSA